MFSYEKRKGCRKMGAILVKSTRIRVKVFRERHSSASRLGFV